MGDDPQKPCEAYSVGCKDDKCQSKITCLSGAVPECSCVDCDDAETTTNCPDPGNLADVTLASLNSTQCKQLCEGLGNDKCKYFRWEKTLDDTHCTLMKDGECTEFLPCLDEAHCVSGQVGCTLDNQRPEPEGTQPCKRMTAADFSSDPGSVHWTCLDQYDPTGFVNIYGAASNDTPADVLTSTICWTAKRCTNFDDEAHPDNKDDVFHQHLVVQCNHPTDDSETTVIGGRWVQYPQSDNDIKDAVNDVEADGNRLRDVTCLPDDLSLDAAALNEVGVSFICELLDDKHYDIQSGEIILKKYNKCILLCNFHHVATIEPKFIEDPVWWKFPAGEGDGEEAKKDNVKCW